MSRDSGEEGGGLLERLIALEKRLSDHICDCYTLVRRQAENDRVTAAIANVLIESNKNDSIAKLRDLLERLEAERPRPVGGEV